MLPAYFSMKGAYAHMSLRGKIYAIAKQKEDLDFRKTFESMIQESIDNDVVVIDGRYIAAGTIFAEQIHADAITADKIRADAITADKIAAGEITTDHLASHTITANKIAAGEITTDHLAAQSITAEKISTELFNADYINAGSIDLSKGIKLTSGNQTIMSVTSDGVINLNITKLNIGTLGDIEEAVKTIAEEAAKTNAKGHSLSLSSMVMMRDEFDNYSPKSVTIKSIEPDTDGYESSKPAYFVVEEYLGEALLIDEYIRLDQEGKLNKDEDYYIADTNTATTKTYESTTPETRIIYTPENIGISGIEVTIYSDKAHTQKIDNKNIVVIESLGTSYRLEVKSTKGNIFRDGDDNETELYVELYHGATNITDRLSDDCFYWERLSSDKTKDDEWNALHRSLKRIQATDEDVLTQTIFNCYAIKSKIVEEVSTWR